MNEKEFNRQILAALTDYANELIAAGRVSVAEAGRYTAHNIARRKNDMGECLHIDMTDERERKQITVGNFTCTVAPCNVFSIICSFEKLAGVRGKEKTRFDFGDTRQDDIVKEYAMFVDGKGNVKTQKKALRRQTEHTATDKNEAVYYQVTPGGVWYCVTDHYGVKPETVERSITAEFVRNGIKNCDGSTFLPIYNALLAEVEAEEQGREVEPTEKVEAIKVETKPIEQEKPKRTQGARFTFSMCGILPGEKIVFTPEQIEVTVADDTHIEFCGELFTLSGFCRAFMPDGKRKPSNAYQGPKYFTYDGVTLVMLRAEKSACVEVETQEVQTEGKTVATPLDLAQERAEAHILTTCHAEENGGLKRMFVKQTKTLVLRVFNGFSTRNRRKHTKCRKFSPQMVVHTLPLPPPQASTLPRPHHKVINNKQQLNIKSWNIHSKKNCCNTLRQKKTVPNKKNGYTGKCNIP